MTAFRIKAGERRVIIPGPGGVAEEVVFVVERADGGVPSGTIEETRSAMSGTTVNKHALLAENVFRLGRAARARTRPRFRIAVIPDQDVTVRITQGYTSPLRVLFFTAIVAIAGFAAIGAWAVFG